ncbi:MAG TPA: exodeoxyribonuclease III [Candidatus Omnitrophota bacterium]|nr:exodeoxyribonuclease III [Candidatus Omnitrophota bacterium]
MKLISWNVNGIRAIAKKGFLEWLEKESPDILCLQETKSSPDQLSDELLTPKGYETFWSSAEKKGYSGVGIFTKIKPLKISHKIGKKEFDSEGRTIIAEFEDFILFNIYFPNGGSGNKRVPFKMAFYEKFLKKVNKSKKEGKKIIICGDVNTAHTEIDLSRPKENQKNTGFLPEEREWITKFINNGYVDTFRHLNKEGGHYTWWDYKTGARARDIGWRIDYFFVTENLLASLKNAFILKNVFGSDHCPIGIELK